MTCKDINMNSLTCIQCCLMFQEDAELVTLNVPTHELADLTVQNFCLMLRMECTIEDLLAILDTEVGQLLRPLVWSALFGEWVRLNSMKGTVLSQNDEIPGTWSPSGPVKIKFVVAATAVQTEPTVGGTTTAMSGSGTDSTTLMDQEFTGSSISGDFESMSRQHTEIGHTGHLGMVRAPTHFMTFGSGPSPMTDGRKSPAAGFPPVTVLATTPRKVSAAVGRKPGFNQWAPASTAVPRPLSKQQPAAHQGFRVRVFLVRHGESEGNVNLDVYKKKPDHALDLTERGKLQARQSGQFLRKYLEKHHGSKENLGHHVRMWVSPYQRTRQTAEEMLKVLNDPNNIPTNREESEMQEEGMGVQDPTLEGCSGVPEHWVDSVRESPFLAEQDFGSFEGHGGATAKEQYREEFARNLVKKDFQGQFWSRWPNGESCFDVCIRMAAIFSDITAGFMMPPSARPPIRTVVIVSHGVTIRAFLAAWCRYSPEWLAVSQNPNNCSINMIEDYSDRGCVFGGFHADPKNPTSPDLGATDAAASARITDPRKEAWRPYLEQSRVGSM